MSVIQNEISEAKAELKGQLKTQKDHLRRNNIRVDDIEENENEAWKNTENKLRSFLYDEPEINNDFV